MSGAYPLGGWTPGRLLAVLDIGKSNAKLVLLDPLGGEEIALRQKPNAPCGGGPLRQLDLAGLEDWLLRSLSGLPERHRIAAILPVAHGAAAVLLDAAGEPLLAPDYEDPALAGELERGGKGRRGSRAAARRAVTLSSCTVSASGVACALRAASRQRESRVQTRLLETPCTLLSAPLGRGMTSSMH